MATNCGNVRVGESFSKTWSGGNDPNRVIPQNYNMLLVQKTDNLIKYRARAEPNRPLSTCTTGGLLGYPTAEFGWDANDDLKLISKLREKIVGSDFNLGIFLGESKQSLGMIADCATRIYQSYRAIRRGNLPVALDIALGRIDKYRGRSLEKVPLSRRRNLQDRYAAIRASSPSYKRTGANQHLEVVYGWIPLLQDVEGAAQALAQAVADPQVFRIAVYRRRVGRITPYMLRQTLGTVNTHCNLIAYLKEDIINMPKLHGMNDPFQLIWELTPYSFVADWFYPIGAFLEARGVASALKGTFVTSKKQIFDSIIYPSPQYYVVEGLPSFYKMVGFNRTVSTSLKVPVPAVKGFSEAFSWLRASNAVALVTQRVR